MNCLIKKIVNQKNLTFIQSQFLMKEMMAGRLTAGQMGAILVALKVKGETPTEILGFVEAMREKMKKIETGGIVIDTCGTGGDESGSFNISTTAALVAAGAGVKVAKHGNRKVTSCCGSADVLEKLGVNIYLTVDQAKEVLQKAGLVFLFAPLYHPAMKKIAKVRGQLKLTTVFNFLGPFVNPALVKRQLIGVPNITIARKLAKVGQRLNYQHLLLVTSDDGFDEISISGSSHILEIKGDSLRSMVIGPEDYGFKRAARREVCGGDVLKNAKIIKVILEGKKGPARDIVLLNSAFAFYVAGRVKDIAGGIALARKSIDRGLAKGVLRKLVAFSRSIPPPR